MELNWLAVVVAFVVFFATGAVWFGPKTFYPVWVRALGIDPQATPNRHSMGTVFALTAIAGFSQVVALAVVLSFVATSPTPIQSAATGFLLALSLTAAGSLSHRLFANQGIKVWLIEIGADVLGLMLAGFVFGLIA